MKTFSRAKKTVLAQKCTLLLHCTFPGFCELNRLLKLLFVQILILLQHSESDSNSRLSEEVQSGWADAATEEAVDDVDLEVQRLLSVYDLVKDEESHSR